MKACGKCGGTDRNASRSCRACLRVKSQAWRKANPERYGAAVAKWRSENPDKVKAQRLASVRVWRKKNRDKDRARCKSWQARNPNAHRDWCRANPERAAAITQKRRAALASAAGRGVTGAQWLARCEEFNHACGYCLRTDVPMTMEHMQPISRGGLHDIDNVIPACQSCNSSKRDRDFLSSALRQAERKEAA